MSFEGQVLCQRMLIGPCALTALGAATVAAAVTAAPLRNLRRVGDLDVGVLSCKSVMFLSQRLLCLSKSFLLLCVRRARSSHCKSAALTIRSTSHSRMPIQRRS